MAAAFDIDGLTAEVSKIAKYSRNSLFAMVPVLLAIIFGIVYASIQLDKLETELGGKRALAKRQTEEIERERLALAAVRQEKTKLEEGRAVLFAEREKLVADQLLLADQLKTLTGDLRRIVPSAVSLVVATDSQISGAESLKRYLRTITDAPVSISRLAPSGAVPYTTEVRYFRYPGDLNVAQHVLLILQNEFRLPRSRVSFVQDPTPHPAGAISVHFDRAEISPKVCDGAMRTCEDFAKCTENPSDNSGCAAKMHRSQKDGCWRGPPSC